MKRHNGEINILTRGGVGGAAPICPLCPQDQRRNGEE